MRLLREDGESPSTRTTAVLATGAGSAREQGLLHKLGFQSVSTISIPVRLQPVYANTPDDRHEPGGDNGDRKLIPASRS